jgi:SAM-dependent methyltransferase
MANTGNHEELYRHARIYDVAFAYRDFEGELDFLLACVEKFGRRRPQHFFEVAAGPGVHAIVAARRGLRATALDLSAEMMELCAKKGRDVGADVRTIVADMRDFRLEEKADLAFNPITSISYLRTWSAVLEHMRSMFDALVPGGIYVVENNHPKDFLKGEHFVPSTWTMSEPGITVQTTWVAECPPKMNAAEQLYEAVGRYVVDRDGQREVIEDRAWLRMTFPAEVALAAKAAGFEVCAELGDLHLDKPLDDSGWRAVTVLKKP